MPRVALFALAIACLAQPRPQLVEARRDEVPVRATSEVTGDEQLVGCRVHAWEPFARTVTIDCSAAMPWTDKKKTIRQFCVVKPSEQLVMALVEPQSRILRWCEVKAKGK